MKTFMHDCLEDLPQSWYEKYLLTKIVIASACLIIFVIYLIV